MATSASRSASSKSSTTSTPQCWAPVGIRVGGAHSSTRAPRVLSRLTAPRLRLLRQGAAIMHPGPMNRGLEISSEAADAANSLILDQVSAGVAVRMSVLYHVLGGSNEGSK